MRLFGLLAVAVFLAYGSPCVPLGHCHGAHVISVTVDRPESVVGAPSQVKVDVEPCHEDPPNGVRPDLQDAGPLVQAPAPVAYAPLASAEMSAHTAIPSRPGERLGGVGLAGRRSGAAALAVLCIFRT